MRTRMSWVLALVAGLLSGCFQVEDELTIQPDGTGSVRLVTRSSVPDEMSSMFGMASGGGGVALYPPTSEAEAKLFFPAKDFTVKVQEQSEGESKTVTIEAAFKDLNALLASPYARAHQLALKVENGTLILKALSGAEGVARVAETKPEGEMADFGMPDTEELQKKKHEMKFSFRVTLPAAVTEANGIRAGKSVTWATERAKCKDAEEFAAKLGSTLEARCPAAGLKLAPVTPPRLGLSPFKDLAVGAAVSTTTLPDTNKVIAAVRFEPHSLSVTRSLDLSGEGSAGQSHAMLQGAVVVPVEFAPQQWGAAKLVEAVDSKGKDLMPKEDEEGMSRMMNFDRYSRFTDDEDEAEGKKADQGTESRQKISFTFKAPEWKVKEIARIKGSVALQYLGAAEVLKISNAVPASLIMDMSKQTSFSSFGGDSERGLVSDPRLEALGLSLRVQTAMAQSGMTILSLEAGGGKVSVVDIQAFDTDGKPWPTTFQTEDDFDENKSLQVMIAGKPKAPLSLGLIVSGVGASVEVPITVEKVPVTNN